MVSIAIRHFRGVIAPAVLTLALGSAGLAQDASVAEQTIDAMGALWGKHPEMRANHAKGVVVEGNFAPSKDAAQLSTAAIFAGPTIPVTVRFSDSTGLPTIPDGDGNANPHGMAVKFHLSGGAEVDIVENSLQFFPVANGAEFRDLLQAIIASGPDAPKPTKLDAFVAAHPTVPKAFGAIATPSSFAREVYNGIDAFIFVDAAGKRQPFRFQVMPVEGTDYLSAADAKAKAADYLMTELPARLAGKPVVFHLMAQLAEPGDPTNDPSKPWPAERKMVDLGTLTLTTAVADSATAQKALLFLPENLTTGIEISDDPLIDARNEAYAISFSHRSQ